MKERVAARTGGADAAEADAELRELVDQTPEGAVFRKDLPFPARLEVHTTRRQEWSGRLYQTSAIERRVEPLNGTRTSVMKLERAGNQVRHTLEQSAFNIPSPDNPEGAGQALADPLQAIAPTPQPHTFRKHGNAWKADSGSGFLTAALAKDLSPVFEQLLIENALAPRTLWFAKKRLKAGDQLVITGNSLPMLLAGNATGSLTLKLEAFEPADGHPCGVFSVTGDYKRRQVPDFDGVFTDEDVTIQSGKLWLSLIHPVILREELDTIQTIKSGVKGGQTVRIQGAIKVSVKRAWKAPAS
jgi:hypothetical protein